MSEHKNSERRNGDDGLRAFEDRCQQAGLRITPQRVAVYRTLAAMNEHPSAEAVFHKVRRVFPRISLDTVNRTLLTLARMGEAVIVPASSGAKRYDANLGNHQHFLCIRCKRVIDFHHKPFDNIPTPEQIAGRFTVLRKTVLLEGLCDRCRGSGTGPRQRHPKNVKPN